MSHTYLDTIGGVALYEHDTHGDEVPMMMLIDGIFVSSGLYAEPNVDPREVRAAAAQYEFEKARE